MSGAAIAAKRGKVNTYSSETDDLSSRPVTIREMEPGDVFAAAGPTDQVPVTCILLATRHHLDGTAVLFAADPEDLFGWDEETVHWWTCPLEHARFLERIQPGAWRVSRVLLAPAGRA